MMVLRFWNKLNLAAKSKREISEWMDDWYGYAPDRLSAWEDYKDECGNPLISEEVKIGIGKQYLKKRKTFNAEND